MHPLTLPTLRARRGRRGAGSAVAAVAAASLLLTGCSDPFEDRDDAASDTPSSAAGSTDAGASTGTTEEPAYPVSVTNCGQDLTFDAAPERVFAYYQQPAETLIALGLEDTIVGYAYPDNVPLPEQEAAYEALPKVSDKGVSFEQVVQTEPDLVYGGYSSAFDEEDGRSRDDFADAGIATFQSEEFCEGGQSSIDTLYEEITNLGAIFGVPDRAEALNEELRAQIADTEAALEGVEPVSVFVYDSGEDSAFTAGGTGIANQIITLAGGSNVFAGVDDTFADVSWEQVVKAQPDVILILDYFGTPSVAEKKQFLLDRPDLADVPAIVSNRFASLTLQDTVLGVRPPQAVASLARDLHPDRF
jgi:iron complex transport system substrate-binding protein